MRRYAEKLIESPWLVLWLIVLMVAVMASGCATSYRPKNTGPTAFSFVLTPEQCTTLKAERRKYHATQEASTYAAGAGLVCTGLMLGFTDSKTATGICTGVGGVAEGVSIFTGTQVADLDAELADGGCGR